MRILIVDDSKDLINALALILSKNNFTVDTSYDGVEALELIKLTSYDVIVLDIMMPRLNGKEVLKEIRNRQIKTPVIMLSAISSKEDIVELLDMGANDYLTKPFSSQELLARIRVVTRNSDTSTGNIINKGNLSLNRSTYEMSVDNESIRLANKEFQIMEALMLSNNPIQTEELMNKIWSFDSNSDINVVWSHISYLRRKMTKLGADVSIKVNRNLGYYLE